MNDISHIEIWMLGTLFFMMRYLIIAGIFFYVFYIWKKTKFSNLKIQKKRPKSKQIQREVFYSLLTFLIYGSGIWLFLFWIENGHTKLYADLSDYGILYFIMSIIIMIYQKLKGLL